jgi:type IV protein arginine methyltransferase
MRETGWYDKPGIKILEGKWQDFLESDDILSSGGFDVIYTDTFSEDYSDLRQFFEHLPDLMADADSRFSFFNGLGATSEFMLEISLDPFKIHSQIHLSTIYTHIYPSFTLPMLDSMLIGAM